MALVRGVMAAARPSSRQGVGGRIDIDQHRRGPGQADGRHRGHRRVRHRDDLVARPDVAGAQRQEDGVGPRVDADAAGHAVVGGEFLLKRRDLAAEDVPAAGQHALDRSVDLRLQRLGLGFQILQWDWCGHRLSDFRRLMDTDLPDQRMPADSTGRSAGIC